MSRYSGVLCGVPDIHCCGGKLISDQYLQHSKVHRDTKEAQACYKRYLVRVLGYAQIGSREFYKEGEPILVITKQIRFGGRLRKGKEKRLMPMKNRGLVY